jgi:anti-sigma factor RsiW
MKHDDVRQALLDLPVASAPADVTARLRVLASRERQRRMSHSGWLTRSAWLDRMSLACGHLLRPLAVPAAGGVLSSILLFGALVDTLNVRQYLTKDIPLGIYTQATVEDLSPFAGSGTDVIVEVTIDRDGRVADYSLPNGNVSHDQLLQIGNLILFSTFTPATAYGQPVSGKILVALRHINVRG